MKPNNKILNWKETGQTQNMEGNEKIENSSDKNRNTMETGDGNSSII